MSSTATVTDATFSFCSAQVRVVVVSPVHGMDKLGLEDKYCTCSYTHENCMNAAPPHSMLTHSFTCITARGLQLQRGHYVDPRLWVHVHMLLQYVRTALSYSNGRIRCTLPCTLLTLTSFCTEATQHSEPCRSGAFSFHCASRLNICTRRGEAQHLKNPKSSW